MTALFTAPLPAQRRSDGLPVLVIGITAIGEIWVVTDEGAISIEPLTNVQLDWRFDWRDHRWVDVGEVDGDTQDDPLDGGPDLPGSVPEPDGVSEGDPVDEEGRQATGDLGDLDTGTETATGD